MSLTHQILQPDHTARPNREMLRLASLTVCGRAVSTAEAKTLLEMLGLIGPVDDEVTR